MSPLGGTRRTLGWAVFGTVTLLALLLGWNLVSLNQSTARLTAQTADRVQALGERSRQELAARGFLEPKEPLPLSLRPDRDPEGAVYPRQIAVLLGPRVLWSLPPGEAPAVAEPVEGTARVEALGGARWLYAFRIPDGRVFVALFDAPGYERSRSRLGLLASFEVAGAGILFAVWSLLAWRLYASYQAAEQTARQAGALLFPTGADPGATDVVGVFQKTVEQLSARTKELERISDTQKQRAESGEAMVQALSANLENAYLHFDAEGNLSKIFGAAQRLLGLPDILLKGRSGARTFASRPEIQALLREARESKAAASLDEVPGAEGRVLQAIAIPLAGPMERPLGLLLVLRDQTDLTRMRAALREREALSRLGEVAAGVAHEVRNGLNVLTLQLQTLQADVPGLAGDPRAGALRREIAQMEQVVLDLLSYAKPLELSLSEQPVRELLEGEAERLAPLFPEASVEVRCPPELRVVCDADSLGRALHNLLRNAGEASAAKGGGGKILLLAREAGARVELRVEDDGPGLPAGLRETAFAPFETQKPGGTGLGLPIARKIARAHGGDLEAADPEFLAGAALSLTLPKTPS